MIRLVLSEANQQVLEGLANVLTGDPEITIGAAINDNRELPAAVRRVKPTLVILAGDTHSIDAVDACEKLGRTNPQLRKVIALGAARHAATMSALAAGAQGVVLKDTTPGILRQTVRTVAAGWSFVDPRLTGKLIQTALRGHHQSRDSDLSAEELHVVQRLLLGLDDAEIARHMGLEEEAVHDHVSSAARKLGASDRAETRTIARREGLV